VIESQDALILFLIGIGIGNLNDGISKLWEREKNGEEEDA
jgi:hypothetical protein